MKMGKNHRAPNSIALCRGKGIDIPIKSDLTGQDRMFLNVLASWAGHLVFVVAGFVLPRIIDRNLGQTSLGIWDFAWSIVNYFSMAGIGIGSSVNRYVARYRAAQEMEELRIAVSSVWVIQLGASAVIAVLSVVTAIALPYFFAARIGEHCLAAQIVIALLGLSIAVQMAFDLFRGIITGCHRWDIHNGLNAGFYAITVLAMITVLMSGGNLVGLSAVYLGGSILNEIARVWFAYRVCPGLNLDFSYFNLRQALNMIQFGIKGLIAGIPSLIIFQGAAILIASFMGPAALAVFSRPVALVRHAEVIIHKFAMVLTPTAGSLQGSGKLNEVITIFVKSAKMGVFLTMPILLLLIFLGDSILNLWMGQRYESGKVLAILAIGCFLPISQQSVLSILTGLNLHGRVGLVSSAATIGTFAVGALLLTAFEWTLERTAFLIGLSFTMGTGIIRPIYACMKLDIRLVKFLREVFTVPILCNLPYAVALTFISFSLADKPLIALMAGLASGIMVLSPLYWKHVVDEGKREEVRIKLRKLGLA